MNFPSNWRPWSTRRQFEDLHRVLQNLDCKLDKVLAKMSQMDDEITQLTSDVTAMRGTVDSAVGMLNGIQAMIQKAVADALAAGATPAQLQSLTDLDTSITAEKADLAAAVAANSPPTPTP